MQKKLFKLHSNSIGVSFGADKLDRSFSSQSVCILPILIILVFSDLESPDCLRLGTERESSCAAVIVSFKIVLEIV